MTVLCLGALLAGLVAASLLPFLPFASALLAATVLGSAWAGMGGMTVGSIVLSALLLLLACQVGYGLGIVFVAVLDRAKAARRGADDKPASTRARPLRTGGRPR